ncbi:MAG TPA: response regulator transcription factor [Bacillales bacterium]|nr:response regulator transcription factor [Bacillales bacterium]
MAKILIVDDDAYIRELAGLFLRNEGFDIYEAEDGMQALDILESVKVDMAILDVMMPNMDGWDLCRELRAFDSDMPILMLTAKGETAQKIKGFELGTDDYMVKPFEPLELAARTKALLKRYKIAVSQQASAGKLTLNRKSYEVYHGEESVTIPLKEFELLFFLVANAGKTFSREHLIEHIWGYDYEGDERTVDVHIKRLRQRFPETESGVTIRTIRGLGYRLEVNSL